MVEIGTNAVLYGSLITIGVTCRDIRDWSLITGREGASKREGGHVKFYPYEKGGAEQVLAMLKGGHKKFWGHFYVVA